MSYFAPFSKLLNLLRAKRDIGQVDADAYISAGIDRAATHPGFLTDRAAIKAWLAENCEIHGSYTVSPSGDVHVEGAVFINERDLQYILVNFKTVSSVFMCDKCPNLRTLVGSPQEVGHNFFCGECPNLLNLMGGPNFVGHNYTCFGCENLTSYMGAPWSIGGDFNGGTCNIRTLMGAPLIVGGSFSCFNNPRLRSFEGLPAIVGGTLDIRYTCHTLPIPECECRCIRRTGTLLNDPADCESHLGPAGFRRLLSIPQPIVIPDLPDWVDDINAYVVTKDIFALAVAFENRFGEPLLSATDIKTPESKNAAVVAALDVPTL